MNLNKIVEEYDKNIKKCTKTEDNFLKKENFLQAILDNTNLAIYLKDVEGKYIFVNKWYEFLSQVPGEFIYGKTDFDFFAPEIAQLFREQDLSVIKNRKLTEFEETITLPGGMYSFITAKFPLKDENGEIYAVGGVCTDITSREKLTEESLTAERERMAVTLRSIGEAVISVNTENKIVLMNEIAEELTGWNFQDAVGRKIKEIIRFTNETDITRFKNIERISQVEKSVFIDKNGNTKIVAANFAPIKDRAEKRIGTVFTFRDITEYTRLKNEYDKTRKLESVGVLAGGIAHEFNNILVGILGNVSLAMRFTDNKEKLCKFLKRTEKAATRANNLTQQLLTFSEGGEPLKIRTSIRNILVESAENVLQDTEISIVFNINEDLHYVELDEKQFIQVVHNIVQNAREAMDDKGFLRINCRNIEYKEDKQILPDGKYIEIIFSDSGEGININDLPNIFDPFYTTKNEKTGLGLAIAHSIITKHGGTILADSETDSGTDIRVILPAYFEEDKTVKIRPDEKKIKNRKIMIMDDEETVREVTGDILEFLGFEVFKAENGEEAIELYSKNYKTENEIDLIIMDLTIPTGMGGEIAVQKVLEINPQAKVIVVSGYSNNPVLARYREYGFVASLKKPFRMDKLEKTILSCI